MIRSLIQRFIKMANQEALRNCMLEQITITSTLLSKVFTPKTVMGGWYNERSDCATSHQGSFSIKLRNSVCKKKQIWLSEKSVKSRSVFLKNVQKKLNWLHSFLQQRWRNLKHLRPSFKIPDLRSLQFPRERHFSSIQGQK